MPVTSIFPNGPAGSSEESPLRAPDNRRRMQELARPQPAPLREASAGGLLGLQAVHPRRAGASSLDAAQFRFTTNPPSARRCAGASLCRVWIPAAALAELVSTRRSRFAPLMLRLHPNAPLR